MLTLSYDKKDDVLYLAFADKNSSYGDEEIDGCVIMRNFATDEITGLTIFDFIDKYNTHQLSKPNLPISIDYDRDVIPLLG